MEQANVTQLRPARPVTYHAEDYSSLLWLEITPLLEKHYAEIAHFKTVALAPDRKKYDMLHDQGKLRVYSARDANRLIGYAVFIVDTSLHYSAAVYAHQDVLFLDKDYRRGRTGIKLIAHAEEMLSLEFDEVLIYHHVKLANDFGPVLERMGYEAVERVYAKRLKK